MTWFRTGCGGNIHQCAEHCKTFFEKNANLLLATAEGAVFIVETAIFLASLVGS